jgi:hypothetical protein
MHVGCFVVNVTEWVKDGGLEFWNHYDKFCCSINKIKCLEQLDISGKSPQRRIGKICITRRLHAAVGQIPIDVCFCAQDRKKGQLQQMGLNKPGTSLPLSPDQQCSGIVIANAIFPLTTNKFKSRTELGLC